MCLGPVHYRSAWHSPNQGVTAHAPAVHEWSLQGHVIPCCGLGSRLEKGENPTNLAVNTAKGRKPGLEGNPRSAGTSAPQQGLGYGSEEPPCSWAPVLGGENRKMLPRSQAGFFPFKEQGEKRKI